MSIGAADVQESAHSERWLISYADFITLLFAFFVTMYSISTVDAKKMQKAVTAFQVAFSEDAEERDAGYRAQGAAAVAAARGAAGPARRMCS